MQQIPALFRSCASPRYCSSRGGQPLQQLRCGVADRLQLLCIVRAAGAQNSGLSQQLTVEFHGGQNVERVVRQLIERLRFEYGKRALQLRGAPIDDRSGRMWNEFSDARRRLYQALHSVLLHLGDSGGQPRPWSIAAALLAGSMYTFRAKSEIFCKCKQQFGLEGFNPNPARAAKFGPEFQIGTKSSLRRPLNGSK